MARLRLTLTLGVILLSVVSGCEQAQRQPADPAGGAVSPPLQDSARGECPAERPRMAVGEWQGPCWRPYSDDSPFNRLLPAEPRLHPQSAAIVARLAGFGPLQHLLAGQAGTSQDFGRPTYYSGPGDPLFTLRCGSPSDPCDIDRHRIRVPEAARPAGGSDGHMTVVEGYKGRFASADPGLETFVVGRGALGKAAAAGATVAAALPPSLRQRAAGMAG